MEFSRREKVIFYGAIPITAAVVGAVSTVVAARIFGTADVADAIRAIVSDRSLDVAAKSKLIELINQNDEQFYSLMRFILTQVSVLLALACGFGLFGRK